MPLEGDVSLYQSILFDGHLQHTVLTAFPATRHTDDLYSACCVPASCVLLCKAVFYPFILQPTLLWGIILPQVQVFAFVFIKLDGVSAGWGHSGWHPVSLACELPLHSLQLGVVCVLPEGRLYPVFQDVDEDTKQYWFQHWPWEMPLLAGLPVILQAVKLSSSSLKVTLSYFSSHFLVCFFQSSVEQTMFVPMIMW